MMRRLQRALSSAWTGHAVLLGIVCLGALRVAPSALPAEPRDASEFSGQRALRNVELILGAGAPRPLGSDEAAAARERLMEALRALGVSPTLQKAQACGADGQCGTVHNVIAELPGPSSGPVILLNAHYDTVAASPGAGDDASGVAIALEVARALKSAPLERRRVQLLFDEGEEAGLLGARAFMDGPAQKAPPSFVVSLEARGVEGPMILFETAGGTSGWAEDWDARDAVASSAFAAAYAALPNDTNLSVFREHASGVGLAFIGGAGVYHTPSDTLEHLDVRTLQHGGEQVLSLLRALDASTTPDLSAGRHVFFDLFGVWVFAWSQRWMVPLALLAASALLALTVLRRRRGVRGHALMMTAVLAVLLAPLPGFGARLLLHRGGAPAMFVAHPEALFVSAWALGLTWSMTVGTLLARRDSAEARFDVLWCSWAFAGIAAAVAAPGVSYLLVVPALAAALMSALSYASPKRLPTSLVQLVPLGVAAALWLAEVSLVLDALGAESMPWLSLLAAWTGALVWPLVHSERTRVRWVPALAGATASLVALAAAFLAPAHSARAPLVATLQLQQDAESEEAQLVLLTRASRLPDALLGRSEARPALLGWYGSRPFRTFTVASFSGEATRGPQLSELRVAREGDVLLVRGTLRSLRAASDASVRLPPGTRVRSVKLGGQRVPALSASAIRWASGWQSYTWRGLPPEGVDVELELESAGEVELHLSDSTPLAGPALSALDGVPHVVPSHFGHQHVVRSRLRVGAEKSVERALSGDEGPP